MNSSPKLIVITGPTACGKSSLGIDVAEAIDGEIINADSIQVYHHFDIGAAKPTETELLRVKHHLVSILTPDQDFNAGKFCILAAGAINDIVRRGKVPVIVGGTGLYIQALLNGLASIGDVSPEAKHQLKAFEASILNDNKATHLHSWLTQLDPMAAKVINCNDIARIRRAILVMLSSARSITEFQARHRFNEKPYHALVIAVCPDRSKLYDRINKRTDMMIDNGLVAETELILSKYKPNVRPLNSIGYKSAVKYLKGNCSIDDLGDEIKRETRHYAKRQTTWWRNQPRKLGWADYSNFCQGANSEPSKEGIIELIKNFIEHNQAVACPDVSFMLINSLF